MNTGNISFHGLKNLGAITKYNKGELIESLSIKLTDDNNGKDLSDFKELLKEYPNKIDKDTVSITLEYYDKDQYLYINDKEIAFSEDTIPAISDVGDLLKRVIHNKKQSRIDTCLIDTAKGYRVFSPKGEFYMDEVIATGFADGDDKENNKKLVNVLKTPEYKIADIFNPIFVKNTALSINEKLSILFDASI